MLALTLASCASVEVPHEPTEKHVASQLLIPQTEQNYWWNVRFRMSWPQSEAAPDFSRDLIIVNEVLAPVLAVHTNDIKLWRFHRRAGRDALGQQFSFIFYSPPKTAGKIFAQINQNPLLAELIDNEILLEVKTDEAMQPHSKAIAGTSDRSWPQSLQNSWPYFIMGVSVMYMDLLEQEVDQAQLNDIHSVTERLKYYREANERLNALWKEQGAHALLHHISALFAYEPVEVQF